MSGGASKPALVYAGAWNAARLSPLLALAMADVAGAAWFLERVLPEGHGLRAILADCEPGLAGVEAMAHDCLHVTISQIEPAWRVLVVVGVAYERGVPRARREEMGKAAKARREAGEFDDVVTALVTPRRVARDFDRAWLNGLVTFEVLAERLRQAGRAGEAAELHEACERQAEGASDAAKSGLADYWQGYRDEAQGIGVFVKLVEPLDPRRVRAGFHCRGVMADDRVRPGLITHELAEGRVVLGIETQQAAVLLEALEPELPADFRARAEAGWLRVWLPVPKLSSSVNTAEQARDVRHALACVLRLQQWLAARARNWLDLLGPKST